MFFAHTGNRISVSVATSRTPASMINAMTPRAFKDGRQEVAEIAIGQGELGATTSTSPDDTLRPRHESSSCHRVAQDVTAGPASDVRSKLAVIGGQKASPTLGFMDGPAVTVLVPPR